MPLHVAPSPLCRRLHISVAAAAAGGREVEEEMGGGSGGGWAAAGGREGEVEVHGNAWSRLCVHHIKYLTGMHALLAADRLY